MIEKYECSEQQNNQVLCISETIFRLISTQHADTENE